MKHPSLVGRARFIYALALILSALPGRAGAFTEVGWLRQAYGQLHYVPGHEGDPAYAFRYPDTNAWSEKLVYARDAQGNPLYVQAPSNWTTDDYPNGSQFNATLGGPATDLDRGVAGGLITLHGLAITPTGALNMEFGTQLQASVFDFQGDGALTVGGGGGGFPILTVLGGGMLTKSGGGGVFELQGSLTLNCQPGATIAAAAGTLQLPGNGGVIDGAVFAPSAGAVIDLVGSSPNSPASNSSAVYRNALTNTAAAAGTVRLSDNILAGNRNDNPQIPGVFNFTGPVFQWTGGVIGAYQGSNPFTNLGTMNIAGPNGKTLVAIFTNNGVINQTGPAGLTIGSANSGGSLTNAAGALYDLRTDAGVNGDGYSFNNLGVLRKSGGAGVSTFSARLNNQGGTVQVDTGTLQLGDTDMLSTGGTFNVTSAAAIFDLGSNGRLTGVYAGSGPGVVRFSHGSLYSTKDAPGAVFNFTGGGFQWTGGAFGDYQGSNLLTNAGVMTMAGGGDMATYALFTNTGTITHVGTGNFAIGQANSGGSFDNAGSGVYNLQTDASIVGDRVFTNEGLLEKTGGVGISTVESRFSNTGAVRVYSGTLQFTGQFSPEGTLGAGAWLVGDGATLVFTQNATIKINQGDVTLMGTASKFVGLDSLADNQGRFALDGGRQFDTVSDLRSSGALDVGAGSTLHIRGALTLAPPAAENAGAEGRRPVRRANPADTLATLIIAIGGAAREGPFSAGVVQADNQVTLAGNLAVRLAAGAQTPTASDTITILTSGKPLKGTFANAPDGATLDAGGGISFRVRYLTNSVVLNVAGSDGATPTVTLTALGSGEIGEGGNKGKAVLTRDGDLSQDLRVSYQIKGTATNGTDYAKLGRTAVIPAGSNKVKIKVKPVKDGDEEGSETVILKLVPSAEGAYTVGRLKKAVITISDND